MRSNELERFRWYVQYYANELRLAKLDLAAAKNPGPWMYGQVRYFLGATRAAVNLYSAAYVYREEISDAM